MLDEFDFADGTYEAQVDDASDIAMNLVAGAAPIRPPKTWMTDPKLDGPTPLTITSDGRVYGHIATWDTEHIGLPNGTRPPRSASGYKFFRTGVLTTEEGDDVPVGQLTLAGGHAPLRADAAAAVKHYDDTASAIADVAAGEDIHGIWVAGALRPGVSDEEIRALRASAPSGDWRVINGRLELVAVCQVNVPGFPVARAMVASGEIASLVAAGAAHMYELRQEETALSTMARLEERLNLIETLLASSDMDDEEEDDEDEDEMAEDEATEDEDTEDEDEEALQKKEKAIVASARQELVNRRRKVELRSQASALTAAMKKKKGKRC
jgi:hypothetical protein